MATGTSAPERLKVSLDDIERLLPGHHQVKLGERLDKAIQQLCAEEDLPKYQQLSLSLRLWLQHVETGTAFMHRCYDLLQDMRPDE